MGHTLVLGGIHCGKNRWAQHQIMSEKPVSAICIEMVCLAEGEAFSSIESSPSPLNSRFERYQLDIRRESLAALLEDLDGLGRPILVGSLSTWVKTLLAQYGGGLLGLSHFHAERDALLELLPRLRSSVYFISSEIGYIEPVEQSQLNLLADEMGSLNQQIAGYCEQVALVMAGLAHWLKCPKQVLV